MDKTVGFIGLGVMGFPMARNLVKAGFDVLGQDVSAEKAATFAKETGAKTVATPAEVAKAASTVITMLPDSPEVEAVLFGQGGIASAEPRDVLVVNSTTMSPQRSVEFAERGKAANIRLLEAPVTRGIRGAIAGTLCFFVGGERGDFETVNPLLEVMGSSIYFIGGIGDATALKLVNNMLTVGNNALVSEAMAAGVRWGLDPQQMFEILSDSSADSYSLREKAPRMIARNFDPGFMIDLGHKDLTLGAAFADGLGSETPMVDAARKAYTVAKEQGLGRLDTSALFRIYEEKK